MALRAKAAGVTAMMVALDTRARTNRSCDKSVGSGGSNKTGRQWKADNDRWFMRIMRQNRRMWMSVR